MYFTCKERGSSWLHLEFNNLKNGNSFGFEQAVEFQERLKDLKNTDRILILTSGHPRFFCAGGNLKRYAHQNTKEEGMSDNSLITEVLDDFHSLGLRKIALVDGGVLGGGMELLSCFDEVWATPKSYFGFWQRRIGLTFGWGGYRRWLKRISEHQLKTLSLEAGSLSASLAYKQGIVDRVLPMSGQRRELRRLQSLECERAQALIPAIQSLTDSNEKEVFEALWFGPAHQKVLKTFKK